ncbi:MAG: xseA, partial [Ilumatobacteraceae bacterium]|nr:xseA [Ilumatobacteraceae bacterium]
ARAAARLGQRPLTCAAEQLRTIDQIEARVRLLDPVHTLARGWSLTRTVDGQIVRSVADVAPGTEIITTLADGSFTSRAESVEPTVGEPGRATAGEEPR